MTTRWWNLAILFFVSAFFALAAAIGEFPTDAKPRLAAVPENCAVDEAAGRVFFSLTEKTTAPTNALAASPKAEDCVFYNWAWHTFLYVTQPQADKRPAFLLFSTMEDVFGQSSTQKFARLSLREREGKNVLSLAPRDAKKFSDIFTVDAGFKQAGDNDAILVDQNKNAVFYAIHMNQVYVDFVRQNKLNVADTLLNAPDKGGAKADLAFPTGSVELKSAWQIVEGKESSANYFTTKARVPWLVNGKEGAPVIDSARPEGREVTVRLLSLHVVGVIEGHHEFVWATFEHSATDGTRDLAPVATANPIKATTQTIADPSKAYALFDKAEPSANLNQFDFPAVVDPVTQRFAHATSVFRVFPGSHKTVETEDEAVTSLNANLGKLFVARDAMNTDARQNYRMAGAVWMDDPTNFKAGMKIKDELLAGENRLSSMAMESFTQLTNPNCFHCHDTTAKPLSGSAFPVMAARQVNVSHILRMFADAESQRLSPKP